MNSTSSNSALYKTNLPVPVGYVFNPSEDDIYSFFIPKRILDGPLGMIEVEEVDLYNKSPDDLFEKRDLKKHIYLFTRLKKEKASHKRIKRAAGDGTWLGQKPTPCRRVFNGEVVDIGTMRQFTYKGGQGEWIMHEYCIENNLLNYYKINQIYGNNNHAYDRDNPNPQNIVFCHIYNKKAKKCNKNTTNKKEINEQGKRKRDFNDDEDDEENVNGNINNNVVSSVETQDANTTMLMTNNYENDLDQPLLPELPQAEEDDSMQQYMMQNFDNMSLPENDEVIKDFISDYGNGDHEYYASTLETYIEGVNEMISLEDLLNYGG